MFFIKHDFYEGQKALIVLYPTIVIIEIVKSAAIKVFRMNAQHFSNSHIPDVVHYMEQQKMS